MTKNLQEILSELGASTDSISLSPTTVQRLREQGIDIPEQRQLTPEQSIEGLFGDERREKALQMCRQLPERPDIPVSSFQSLYTEIRVAIILGLNGAAITLSGILIEYALKYSAYKVEMGGFVKYDSQIWDEFEELDFAHAIARATKNRLLPKDARKSLNDFRVRFRNPYNHYNIRKITANYYHDDLKILNTQTGDVEVHKVAAKDNPVLQAIVKPVADADSVLEVYAYADSIVKYLWTKIRDLPNAQHSVDTQA